MYRVLTLFNTRQIEHSSYYDGGTFITGINCRLEELQNIITYSADSDIRAVWVHEH